MHERNIARLGRLRQRFEKYLTTELLEAGYKGFGPAHGRLAVMLNYKGTMSITELAYAVEKRKPTVSVLVDKLQKQGLVKCAKDDHDNRVTLVTLTDKGRSFAELTSALSKVIAKQASNGVSEENQDIFEDVLTKLLDNLEEYQ